MAIVTTYVCDISGASSTEQSDFMRVQITSSPISGTSYETQNKIMFLHNEVATRLGFKKVPRNQEQPKPVSIEDQLIELIGGIVSDQVHDAVAQAMNNR